MVSGGQILAVRVRETLQSRKVFNWPSAPNVDRPWRLICLVFRRQRFDLLDTVSDKISQVVSVGGNVERSPVSHRSTRHCVARPGIAGYPLSIRIDAHD